MNQVEQLIVRSEKRILARLDQIEAKLNGSSIPLDLGPEDIAAEEPVAIAASSSMVKLRKVDRDTGKPLFMSAPGLTQTAKADGWEVVQDAGDRTPEVQVEPVDTEAAEVLPELLAAIQTPLYQWLIAYLEENCAGVVPVKIIRRVKVDGLRGEVLKAPLHRAAVKAQEAHGFVLECQDGEKPCDGRRRDCPLRRALRMLAAQPDFPLRKAEDKGGPWGGTYVFGD